MNPAEVVIQVTDLKWLSPLNPGGPPEKVTVF
jgi:hypothetical protein